VLKRVRFYLILGLFAGAALAAAAATPQQTRLTPQALSAAKSLGSSSAPIRIDEYADYECPACRNFYQGTVRPLIDNYVSTGKVYFVYHDFPLSMHKYARDAARWANAAAAAGQFEPVQQALFAKQDDWVASGNIQAAVAAALSPAEMKKVQLIFQQDAAQLDAAVAADQASGQAKNIEQTPSIFVTAHGTTQALPPGGVSYTLMKQYVDYLLGH
jgi:protein-disulfide isomerase